MKEILSIFNHHSDKSHGVLDDKVDHPLHIDKGNRNITGFHADIGAQFLVRQGEYLRHANYC